ncbi:unnamed protein product [Prorocentrum cordatum]|uniref:Beta-lactamase-related domain-containing protein n=1 Tax=Prorocentrum cordatum TaxID=2364126 RepID=A0ABN9RZ01_9DINO|nr:unnamed protein product [Polarella glacialis]
MPWLAGALLRGALAGAVAHVPLVDASGCPAANGHDEASLLAVGPSLHRMWRPDGAGDPGTLAPGRESRSDVGADPLFERSVAQSQMAEVLLVEQAGSEPNVSFTGVKNKETGEAVGPNDSFAIGSCTKMFTAVAVMQLSEQGALYLSSPVTDYIPLEIVDNLTSGNARGLEIRHLLGHCSGMGDYLNWGNDSTVLKFYGPWRDGAENYTPADIFEITQQKSAPAFTLQTAGIDTYDDCPYAAYSNTGYIMLGVIIEQASGLSWEDYVASEIFARVNMSASSFLTDGAPSVTGYAYGVWDGPVGMIPSLAWSAGEIVSTARDMASFMRGAMEGALFKFPETLQLWLDAPRHKFQYVFEYGYGLMRIDVGTIVPGAVGVLVGHGGQTFGFHSGAFYDQVSGTVYILLQDDSQLDMPTFRIVSMCAEKSL